MPADYAHDLWFHGFFNPELPLDPGLHFSSITSIPPSFALLCSFSLASGLWLRVEPVKEQYIMDVR